MNGTLNLLQQCKIPSTKLYLKRNNPPKGSLYYLREEIYSAMYFCRTIQASAYEVVRKSYVPAIRNKEEAKIVEKAPAKLENVGAFQKLPMVMPSIDILHSALRKSKKVSLTKDIRNIAKRERTKGAMQLDALMKELAVPLREYTENFPNKRYLHPYECSLIELTLGEGNYEKVLARVDNVRKKIVSAGKQYASLCSKSLTKKEAEERLNEGIKKLEEIFHKEKKAIDELLNITKTLRAMPIVNPEIPTLCLVGAPNVGKSSLVRLLSTGKPEVCNYPFTTRGILMGHLTVDYQRFQVTDTPGLLNRSEDERNNLEKLTLAVLSHLPTAILYVHDLSGECGTAPLDQFVIYKEIRKMYKNHLWLDVVSKCDLLKGTPLEIIGVDDEMARYRRMGPEGALHVSVISDVGVSELKTTVRNLLISQLERIKSEEAMGHKLEPNV